MLSFLIATCRKNLLPLCLGPAGCVPAQVESVEVSEPSSPPKVELSKLISQPGDTEPVRYQIARTDLQKNAESGSLPMQFGTVIRNRCKEDATFAVGAADLIPRADSPTEHIGAGRAIQVYLAEGECIHLRTPSGYSQVRACESGGWIVMTGDGPCTDIIGIRKRSTVPILIA